MVTKEQARELMEGYLRKQEAKSSHRLVISDEYTQEEDFGWVFFYTTEQYDRTRDPAWALVGNAPVIVDRETGVLHVTGTAKSHEYYIQEYRRKRKK